MSMRQSVIGPSSRCCLTVAQVIRTIKPQIHLRSGDGTTNLLSQCAGMEMQTIHSETPSRGDCRHGLLFLSSIGSKSLKRSTIDFQPTRSALRESSYDLGQYIF